MTGVFRETCPDIPREFRECRTCNRTSPAYDGNCLRCGIVKRDMWMPRCPKGTIRVIDEKQEPDVQIDQNS